MPSKLRATLLVSLLLSSSAWAQSNEPVPPSTEKSNEPVWSSSSFSFRHHGLFFRGELGVGYLSTSTSLAGSDLTVSGTAAIFAMHIGGTLRENLILGLHIFDTIAPDPTVSYTGQSVTASGTTASLFGIGPELVYYFMPANVYIYGTLAITKITFEGNGQLGSTEPGIGARFGVGKEWWVNEHWGMGLSGYLAVASNKDKGTNPTTFSSLAVGACLTATYN